MFFKRKKTVISNHNELELLSNNSRMEKIDVLLHKLKIMNFKKVLISSYFTVESYPKMVTKHSKTIGQTMYSIHGSESFEINEDLVVQLVYLLKDKDTYYSNMFNTTIGNKQRKNYLFFGYLGPYLKSSIKDDKKQHGDIIDPIDFVELSSKEYEQFESLFNSKRDESDKQKEAFLEDQLEIIKENCKNNFLNLLKPT
jgi:hypothetical protein